MTRMKTALILSYVLTKKTQDVSPNTSSQEAPLQTWLATEWARW